MHRSYSTWQVFAEYPPVQACRCSLHCLQLLACCACAKSDALQPIKTMIISDMNTSSTCIAPARAQRSPVMSRGSGPSKRNLLDTARVAQGLDGNRLTGSLLSPRSKTIEERNCTMQARARVAVPPIEPKLFSRTCASEAKVRLRTHSEPIARTARRRMPAIE